MGKAKRLSQYEQGQVDAFIEAGLSNRAIAKKIGQSEFVIRNYKRQGDAYGTNKNTGREANCTGAG